MWPRRVEADYGAPDDEPNEADNEPPESKSRRCTLLLLLRWKDINRLIDTIEEEE